MTSPGDSHATDPSGTLTPHAEITVDPSAPPVKKKGPKRWGVEPDWSKLPSTPRRRPVVDDGPAWGTSTIDARSLIGPQDGAGHERTEVAPAWQTPGFLNESAATTTPPALRPVPAPVLPPVAAAPVDDGPEEDLRAEAEAALRTLVGRENVTLRDDQWTAIQALVAEQRRALVVQRTGWGKSAVYFVATTLLRARGAGPTIIISPLLALMRDQIAAAQRAGIRAATINSANVTEWDQIHAQIMAGEVDVLLCSPERLNNPGFRDQVLPKLAADAGLVVIDEAHCVSDWGHDFRPDYRRIRTLLAELPAGIPVLATTATANARVTQDVAEQLEITGATAPAKVLVLRGGLDRESLHLNVLRLGDQPTRVAWLTAALSATPGSGIVYCLTVSVAEQVAAQLKAAGFPVAAYTGRTDPTERESLEADLKANRVKALVATSALGMGFDKPDLAFVMHLGAPNSPIAYYQQVGRAGRGVGSALVVLLPGEEDQRIWEYFGSLAFPGEDQVRATLDALTRGGTQSTQALEPQVDLTRSRLEMMLKVLDVDGAVTRVAGGWAPTGQDWVYDAARYARVEQARLAEQRAMLAYEATDECRMVFLRKTLDDPELVAGTSCGRCDNCIRSTAGSGQPVAGGSMPAAPSAEQVASARQAMDVPGVILEARRMWPTGMASLGVSLAGRIGQEVQAQPGRAIARLDGLGWSAPLRDLFAAGTPDGEVPIHLRRAAAQVLDAWPEVQEVDGVIAVRSATRPELVLHLAQGLAKYLKKPFVGMVGPNSGHEAPGRHDINSAMRLAGVVQRLALELSPAALAGLNGRSILLVDDFVDSGWTIATSARLLREAGATAVLPFALAQR